MIRALRERQRRKLRAPLIELPEPDEGTPAHELMMPPTPGGPGHLSITQNQLAQAQPIVQSALRRPKRWGVSRRVPPGHGRVTLPLTLLTEYRDTPLALCAITGATMQRVDAPAEEFAHTHWHDDLVAWATSDDPQHDPDGKLINRLRLTLRLIDGFTGTRVQPASTADAPTMGELFHDPRGFWIWTALDHGDPITLVQEYSERERTAWAELTESTRSYQAVVVQPPTPGEVLAALLRYCTNALDGIPGTPVPHPPMDADGVPLAPHRRRNARRYQHALDEFSHGLIESSADREWAQLMCCKLALSARQPGERNRMIQHAVQEIVEQHQIKVAVEEAVATIAKSEDAALAETPDMESAASNPSTEPEVAIDSAAAEPETEQTKRQARAVHWTKAWAAAAELDDETNRDGDGQRFDRKRYYQELPQPSDRPERRPRTRRQMRKILDRELIDLDGPKEAVLDYLTYRLRAEAAGDPLTSPRPLCLVGPSGCGKTALATAIAAALDRPLAVVHGTRISTGIDVLGADRKWHHPEVGQPIQAALEVGTPDGVILWDAVDACPHNARHMPSGGATGPALARLLDPDAQHLWTDALMELPYDMSGYVMVLTTTHVGDLDPQLRAAVTLVHMQTPDVTQIRHIAQRRTIPRLRRAVDAQPGRLRIPGPTLNHIMAEYCPPGDMGALTARLQRCLAAQLDANPRAITPRMADAALTSLGREAHWSAAWQRRLAEAGAEESELRDYLNELPQAHDVGDPRSIDLQRAAELMDASHYGLQRVKNEILDQLATIQRTGTTRPRPLALIGPPGTGKTTLTQAIAQAMGRPMARITLGGTSADHVLRGWRGGPGRVLQAFRDHGRADPIILLDEIDKLGAMSHTGLHGAALELLDPAQNATFNDQFLNLPYDVGRAWFIATGNDRNTLPPELQDRLQIIELPDYTNAEKTQIIQRFAAPKALRAVGANPKRWRITDDAVAAILARQRNKTGLRGVTEDLTRLIQRRVREASSGNITAADVERILGGDADGSGTIGF